MDTRIDQTALLLVDIQKGFDELACWGPSRSNAHFEANVVRILQRFRSLRDRSGKTPLIIHIYHESENPKSPLHPDSPGCAFQEYAKPETPSEPVFSKSVNSASIGTTLEQTLRERAIRRLYVIGLTTDHCVSTTVRMAGNLKVTDWVDDIGVKQQGDGVYLVEDATAAHAKGGFDADLVHALHAESLKEFATVIKTSELLKDLQGP